MSISLIILKDSPAIHLTREQTDSFVAWLNSTQKHYVYRIAVYLDRGNTLRHSLVRLAGEHLPGDVTVENPTSVGFLYMSYQRSRDSVDAMADARMPETPLLPPASPLPRKSLKQVDRITMRVDTVDKLQAALDRVEDIVGSGVGTTPVGVANINIGQDPLLILNVYEEENAKRRTYYTVTFAAL